MILYQYHTVFCNYFSHRNPNYPSVPNSLAATLAPKSSPKILFLSSTRRRRYPFPLPSAAPNPNHDQEEKLEENPQENPKAGSGPDLDLLKTIPRKPRRGRKSEAVAVEDFVRSSLEKTFAEIRKQIGGSIPPDDSILKPMNEGKDSERGRKVEEDREVEVADVVDSEDPNWPLDSDVGWGIRASEFFDKYPIKNVVDENGVEVDWEGEMVDPLVKEINCLEWESFAFHPSPLMVLVFERYSRIADNWRAIKELEKAAKVYWNAKDRLPPRTVKIDINIERDLAYALKVRECPQLLFLRGNRIVYREKEIRSSEELVQMIAFFYYKARRPSWVDYEAIAPLY